MKIDVNKLVNEANTKREESKGGEKGKKNVDATAENAEAQNTLK